MPRKPTVTEIRLDNIAACLTSALTLLNELNDAFSPPFIQLISSTTLALMTAVQNVKRNKNECVQVMENIPQVLCAIVNLHIESETVGSLPPSKLEHIGKFMETLHKIYTFIEAQQDRNKIKYMFHNSEKNTLLKHCRTGMDKAMEVFKVNTGTIAFRNIDEMRNTAEIMHNELLELISRISDVSTIIDKSSMHLNAINLKNSSSSFSMLPSKPKIFYGRELELEDIMRILKHDLPRIAILGGGGMGKTSLARAVLHHPDTSTKFEHRFFVAAESATNSLELAALIGLHVGLNPGKDLSKPVVQYFSRKPPCLLILDNLETAWEPIESRGGTEEFLSQLTEVEHLALIVCVP
ncbi:hypothetical protein MVEN_02202800 [Mycena venus]|uniref:Novel STAND NTPase 1 domain-containing protein n=1 Tax=Mycena venus TaxID=2733690 RepID=A0A8H6X6L0_9AGAR|nr:hypothetical protein MVEN_02202800 [Mycena venus]